MGPVTECPPFVLAHGFVPMQIRKVSKGVCPIGRRMKIREGKEGSEASVGRGKAKRFPLQGHLSPVGNPFRCGRCGGALRATHPSFMKIDIAQFVMLT